MDVITPVDELFFGLHATIERCGWAVISVFGERGRPPWAYTMGLEARYDHPELVVVGLDDRSASAILNRLAVRVSDGEQLNLLPRARTTVGGQPLLLRPVHDAHWETDRFATWLAYYDALGETPARWAFQVFWADDAGHFPGDPCFDPSLRRYTRRLDRRPRRTGP